MVLAPGAALGAGLAALATWTVAGPASPRAFIGERDVLGTPIIAASGLGAILSWGTLVCLDRHRHARGHLWGVGWRGLERVGGERVAALLRAQGIPADYREQRYRSVDGSEHVQRGIRCQRRHRVQVEAALERHLGR